jgi:iron complex transport system substrate-binding protein
MTNRTQGRLGRRQAWHAVGLIAAAVLLAVPPTDRAAAQSSAPAPLPSRQVEDMAGRRVDVPQRLDRIASVGGSPAVNAFLFLFGLGDRIVNGLPAAFQGEAWRWQRRFAPGLAGKPAVSGPPPAWTPNIESLLPLKPDLSFVVSAQAAQQLERADLRAVVLNWDKGESIHRTVDLLARITGDRRQAEDYLAWEKDLLGRVDSRLRGVGATTPAKVLYFRYSTLTQPIMVPANQLIARAGGRSVTADANPLQLDVFPFSIEQVLAWQPDVMLLAFADEVQPLLADPRFAQVPAVRNKRVYAVPHGAHIWTHYTPEQPLGVLWLAKLLYPERLADVDPVAESGRFYSRFFGVSLSDAELQEIVAAAPAAPRP